MEVSLSPYEQRVQEANPQYASVTHEGHPISLQESAFIHYYIQCGSAIDAFKKAGFTYPRRKKTKLEKEMGIQQIGRGNDKSRQGSAEKEKEEDEVLSEEYKTIPEEYKQTILDTIDIDDDRKFQLALNKTALDLLHMPAIQSEIAHRIQGLKDAQVADTHEVMAYFTAVMRGQVLDQFGLEASLQERTRAAECLAKRLIDIPKKMQVSGTVGNQPVQLIIQERDEEDDIIDGEYEEV
jgi:phage terminase small subunit